MSSEAPPVPSATTAPLSPSASSPSMAAESTTSEQPPTLKLSVFPPDFSPEELLLRQEDFPSLKVGDVLKIHQPTDKEDSAPPKLLLQVASLRYKFHHSQ